MSEASHKPANQGQEPIRIPVLNIISVVIDECRSKCMRDVCAVLSKRSNFNSVRIHTNIGVLFQVLDRCIGVIQPKADQTLGKVLRS